MSAILSGIWNVVGSLVTSFIGFAGASLAIHPSSQNEEMKLHNRAMEKMQRDHTDWIERRQNAIDAERKRRLAAQTSESHMKELDSSLVEYARAWERRHPQPQFHQNYLPSPQEQKQHYIGAAVTVGVVETIAYYVL